MSDEPLDDVVEAGEDDAPATPSKRRKESIGQTIGGVLFGFEQQVLRTMPPPQELVHHARPDAPIPAGDGSLIHIGMPDLLLPDAPGLSSGSGLSGGSGSDDDEAEGRADGGEA